MYTVKQLADIAGVSVRTLHYYDQIGLLRAARAGANGYRCYDEAAVLRLQQILLYRELGLELAQIKAALDSPGFDLTAALRAHRRALAARISQLQNLISTVDSTLRHVTGEINMSGKQLFAAFSDEQQKQYEREARLQYGPDIVNESRRRWNSYTKAQRQAIMDEGSRIYSAIVAALEAGLPPSDDTVQAALVRWHNHIRYFYEPTLEILRGLGDLYNDSPDFAASFAAMHPELAAYMRAAIVQYVDELETAAVEALLEEDSRRARGAGSA